MSQTFAQLADIIESQTEYWDQALNREELCEAIATALWGEPVPLRDTNGRRVLHWDCGDGTYRWTAPDFLGSLDFAATLYPVRPKYIPSDPRRACAEALRTRALRGEEER